MRYVRWTGLVLASLLACPALATADNGSFKQHYQAYQQALSQRDLPLALQELEQAYTLAKQIYAPDSEDFANLTLSLANHRLRDDKIPRQDIYPLYSQALSSLEKLHGPANVALLDPLLGAAKTAEDHHAKLSLLERAIDIAEQQQNPALLAEVQLEAYEVASNTFYYGRKHLGWLKQAHAYASSPANRDANLTLRTTFHLGNALMGSNELRKSAELLTTVVDQTKALNFSHPYALASHARLVNIYERLGKSEQATPHCIALGSMKPWDDNQEQAPLFRVEPKYPLREAERGVMGYAVLSFTINTSGAVQNVEVLETGGAKSFGEESAKALAKWRFAPKFVDGKAVTASSKVRIDFALQGRTMR